MRILIVEDRTSDARLVKQCLLNGKAQFNVEVADRFSDALKLARAHPPDAILLDLTLPDAGALEAVGRLRAALPKVPIILLGSKEDDVLASEAVKSGAQDYLIKSELDQKSLRRALQYAVERQQLLDRLASSEARLAEENVTLRRLTDSAARVFATLDVRAVVGLLAAEARRLWGGRVALYALRSTGHLVCIDAQGGERPKADLFLTDAFASERPVLSSNRLRLALPVPGTGGSNEWVLDINSESSPFGESDVFALELLRQYVGIAVQNVALFGELQSQRSSVLQLNQLKDDLIAVLAHDFKGPLTTIIGFTELLEQHALEGADADGALRSIRQSASRLAALASDTLSLSRVEQGELNLAADPVNIADIVRQTIDALRGDRRIDMLAAAQEAVVRGDPARLRQVLENIIGNALKYSPPDQPITVRLAQSEESVRVSVEDHGIGVPPDEIKFLFERFTRASNAKRSKIEGTGVGLYLAKTLVERHGGTIEVQSTIGKGSAFTVVLPRMRHGLGGVLRVIVLTADDNLGPYILHELRGHGFAARHDKTLTAVLERLAVEEADIVIVDRDTVTSDMYSLFKRARAADRRIGLIRVGGGRGARRTAKAPWDASLPNPFLALDLQEAIAQANRVRLEEFEALV
ncbi:MAG TPA: ATP-binding protein [Candidatus Baltobacteraceae bacterium]|jgi:signal transduction histidine kinase|nr:ATP-binding protein [Candidatus Baltobacteraceae bacterium]